MKAPWHSNDARSWMARLMTIVVTICLLVWLGTFVVVYLGDEYASPAWDEQSVPPPRAY